MRFGPRELLILLVLIAMPLASYWYVFRPRNEVIEQAKLEIQHKEQMLQKLSEATARTADLAAANEEIKKGIEVIESRLPSDREVDRILQQIADLARSHDLRLPKFKTDKPVPYASYNELPLEVKITGEFEAFYAFMLDLENIERITRVPELDVSRADKEEGQMEATFTLSIYFETGDLEDEA